MSRNDFRADRNLIERDGQPILAAATEEIARALVLTLNDAQLLFTNTPMADQEFVEKTLWPAVPDTVGAAK